MKQGLVTLLFIVTVSVAQAQTYYEGLRSKVDKASGRYGFVNAKGKWMVEPKYDSILQEFKYGQAIVLQNGKCGTINAKGETQIPFQYRLISAESRGRYPVQNDQYKWGFCDATGTEIIACQFENFRFSQRQKELIVQQERKWGVINGQGEVIIPFLYRDIKSDPQKKAYILTPLPTWHAAKIGGEDHFQVACDSLHYLGEGRYAATMIGQKALLNEQGQSVLKTEFDYISSFFKGLAIVRKDTLYGVLRKDGSWLLELRYRHIRFQEVYLEVGQYLLGRTYYSVYDYTGKALSLPMYTSFRAPTEGLIPAQDQHSRWGLLKQDGQSVMSCIYDSLGNFNEGLAICGLYIKGPERMFFSLINKQGQTVVPSEHFQDWRSGKLKVSADGLWTWVHPKVPYDTFYLQPDQRLIYRKGSKYGLLDPSGNTISTATWDDMRYVPGSACYSVEKDHQPGLLRNDGKVVLKPTRRFQYIGEYREGLFIAHHKGAYGFCDSIGDIWISTRYEEVRSFSEGFAAVKLKGKWGFVNRDETLIAQPWYESVCPYAKGKAMVQENGKWFFIDKNGRALADIKADTIIEVGTRYLFLQSGKWGLLNHDGKEWIPAKYDNIEPQAQGYFILIEDGRYGLIGPDGSLLRNTRYLGLGFNADQTVVFAEQEASRTQKWR
jgi:hypothetical protein